MSFEKHNHPNPASTVPCSPAAVAERGAVDYFQHMKIIMLLSVLAGMAVGCAPPKAPAMKRLLNDEPIDMHYLKDVFVPSYGDQSSRLALSNSVIQLEEHLAEFRAFMHQVEIGRIPVIQNRKGMWVSHIEQKDAWIAAVYSDRLGPVVDFQKHKNQDPFPLIYAFQLSTNGYVILASTMDDGFKFDERGRVQEYWRKPPLPSP